MNINQESCKFRHPKQSSGPESPIPANHITLSMIHGGYSKVEGVRAIFVRLAKMKCTFFAELAGCFSFMFNPTGNDDRQLMFGLKSQIKSTHWAFLSTNQSTQSLDKIRRSWANMGYIHCFNHYSQDFQTSPWLRYVWTLGCSTSFPKDVRKSTVDRSSQ